MSEHTKTPWRTGIGNLIVFDRDGYAVANATVFHRKKEDGESAANAAHIVKCVNSHDALVAAVRRSKWRLLEQTKTHQEDCVCPLCIDLREADAALALAEPQPKQGKE